MILALAAATLAIVVQDHTSLRAAPSATAAALTPLWQGDVLEVRGERAGYLKVYDYRRERGGYLKSETVRALGLGEADAPGLLAVLRFLRDSPGAEALGISYGAAYLKAVPARGLTAEPFDAIARMAERLADQASGTVARPGDVAAHLEVVEQFGIHMRSFERSGRVQICYDGDLYRRALTQSQASSEERARAALGLTRPDCIDPNLGPALRATLDDERRLLLEQLTDRGLNAMMRSRLHARRAGVWASLAYERARRGEAAAPPAQRALEELLAVHPDELGADRRAEYLDAVVRVSAVRWAVATTAAQTGPLFLRTTPADHGQTCIALSDARRASAPPLVRRCTYGVVWTTSAQALAGDRGVALAVQPLETWRELWVFHEGTDGWTVEVLSPGADDPEEGYVEFAGFAPATKRLLVAREVKERGHFTRHFEELRLDDLALVRHAGSPELLRDFGRWQDPVWRHSTLALH